MLSGYCSSAHDLEALKMQLSVSPKEGCRLQWAPHVRDSRPKRLLSQADIDVCACALTYKSACVTHCDQQLSANSD